MLESYLRERQRQHEILLMTHIVIGFPNFDDSWRVVEQMVEAGVDLMELQIPFSEPMADGPVILHANQSSLRSGATVERCLEFAEQAAKQFDIPFLFMSYYNIIFKYGVGRFASRTRQMGLHGAIVPDLPPEEAGEYLEAMTKEDLNPIFIFAPSTSPERLELISRQAKGFIYCVARKGVTGSQTQFSEDIADYLVRCRKATTLPLAVGFGVQDRSDVDFLRGRAEIAVIGSKTLRLIEEQGPAAVGPFLRSLR